MQDLDQVLEWLFFLGYQGYRNPGRDGSNLCSMELSLLLDNIYRIRVFPSRCQSLFPLRPRRLSLKSSALIVLFLFQKLLPQCRLSSPGPFPASLAQAVWCSTFPLTYGDPLQLVSMTTTPWRPFLGVQYQLPVRTHDPRIFSVPSHPCLVKLYLTCIYQLQPFPFPFHSLRSICFFFSPLLSFPLLCLVD